MDRNYSFRLPALRQGFRLLFAQLEAKLRERIGVKADRVFGFGLIHITFEVQELVVQIADLELIVANIASVEIL